MNTARSFEWRPCEREAYEAARAIAGATDFNSQASRVLADAIAATGKPVDQLTVGEFRQIIDGVQL